MCTLIGKCRKDLKSVCGYKIVVVDKHGNYYSPSTGIRYNIGKVKPLKNKGIHHGKEWSFPYSYNIWYRNAYAGYTTIFKTYESAFAELEHLLTLPNIDTDEIIIIEMELSKDLMHSSYKSHNTYSGKYIIKMKKSHKWKSKE